jgi:ribosomal protein L14E/L6E/L27E
MNLDKIVTEAAKHKIKKGVLNNAVFEGMASLVPENEELVYVAEGKYKLNKAVALIAITDKNVYAVTHPTSFQSVQTTIIPISKITSVSSKVGLVMGQLFISEGTVNHEFGTMLPALANETVSAIHKAQNMQSSGNVQPQISQADELSKFKKLLDDGVLTQEEFDKKKAQILGL